jgi:hypothetical protein
VKATLRASYKLDAKERHGTVAQNRRLVEQESPAAANSLREALEQWFTINRLGISPSLHCYPAATNLIESPQSGVRMQTRRLCRWRDAAMGRTLVGAVSFWRRRRTLAASWAGRISSNWRRS